MLCATVQNVIYQEIYKYQILHVWDCVVLSRNCPGRRAFVLQGEANIGSLAEALNGLMLLLHTSNSIK